MRRLFLVAVLLAVAGTAHAAGPQRAHVLIFFQSWSAKLDDAAMNSIHRAANWAKQHPDEKLTVIGYASTIGSVEANKDLSRLRSQIVSDALVADGVPLTRILQHSKGGVAYALDAQESRRVDIALGEE